MVFNRLCAPDSKLGCLRWLDTVAMPAMPEGVNPRLACPYRVVQLQSRCMTGHGSLFSASRTPDQCTARQRAPERRPLGWCFLSMRLDDDSRYIIAWRLCTTMRVGDVTATLEDALAASGCHSATVSHRPRLKDLCSMAELGRARRSI